MSFAGIKLDIDIKGLKKALVIFDNDISAKAEAKTLNDIGALAKTSTSKAVRSYWALSVKQFNQESRVSRTHYKVKKKVVKLRFSERRFGLQEFRFKVAKNASKKRGTGKGDISVQLHNKRSGFGALVLRHAFVADWGYGKRIFARDKKTGRLRRRQAPSLANMVANRYRGADDVNTIIDKIMTRRAKAIYMRNLQFYISKIK